MWLLYLLSFVSLVCVRGQDTTGLEDSCTDPNDSACLASAWTRNEVLRILDEIELLKKELTELKDGSSHWAGDACPAGFTPISGPSCYRISDKAMSWSKALEACKSVGARLLAIETPTEQDAVIAALKSKHGVCRGNMYALPSLPTSAIKASSCYSSRHCVQNARLNTNIGSGSWSSAYNRVGEWIQLDLGVVKQILAIATQGRHNVVQWVTHYKLQYSNNGQNFITYTENGNVKQFIGNSDQNKVVINYLSPGPIPARYVRILPTVWRSHISMRFDVIECLGDAARVPISYWTGGNDLKSEGKFYWDGQGQEVSSSNLSFVPRQPDDKFGTEDCLALDNTHDLKLADFPCTGQFPFICEKP